MVYGAGRWPGTYCIIHFRADDYGIDDVLSGCGDKKICGLLPEVLARINAATGRRFVIIIDEWDVVIRDEAANLKVQNEYIVFYVGY